MKLIASLLALLTLCGCSSTPPLQSVINAGETVTGSADFVSQFSCPVHTAMQCETAHGVSRIRLSERECRCVAN